MSRKPRFAWAWFTVPALLLVIASLCGCLVPPRPTYDAECVPSRMDYIEIATDQIDLFDVAVISDDPQEAYDQALAEGERLGLQLVPKHATGSSFDGFSTTLPNTILLGVGWDDKPIDERAWLLWHELVHKHQWNRLGAVTFGRLYAVPEGRWALEVAAYTMSFRVMASFGVPQEAVNDVMVKRAGSLRKGYRLTAMPSCTLETTVDIWQSAA